MKSLISNGLERFAAAALLVVLSPLSLALCVILLIFQGRPVFFRQQRAGLHGSVFDLYKLRTMTGEPTDGGHAVHVTPVGRALRRFGLDELPQLVNIVRGEMSFIGPRPALVSQAARFGPAERRRLEVRPGITGWAQINGRNSISWERRIELDMWYVENRTLWIDLKILLRTAATVVSGRGVYGAGGSNPDFGGSDASIARAA